MSRNSSLFRKYYQLTALIVLVFVVLGFLTSRMLRQFSASPTEARHSVFYAKLIDHLNPDKRPEALRQILDWGAGSLPMHFSIVDQAGTVLFPPGEQLPFPWEDVRKPETAYETAALDRSGGYHGLIRFAGDPPQYLYVNLNRSGPRRLSGVHLSSLAMLAVSALLGVTLAMSLLFRSLRKKARLADGVLAELQKGNLKARFPITKMDEIGEAMSRFNRMADEIERLVERVQKAEKSRMSLLQELAHDLRTPVASLKNLLETLQSKEASIPATLRQELLSLSLKETDYFERLVEDLLVLAQVSEPRYRAGTAIVSLNDLLEDETGNAETHGTVRIKKEIPQTPVQVRGDAHLLRRMFRNGLDNAVSFAKTEVTVRLSLESPHEALIVIEDDGKGFSEEALASYGERRISRALGTQKGARLSVGLGSVILRTVAQLHGGFVSVANRQAAEGRSGARLRIMLPTADL